MKVIKRDGRKVEYNSDKIVIAISQANREVGGKDKVSRSSIEFITKYIESLGKTTIAVEEIQDIIERKLMEFGKFTLAKKYILYREKHAMIREANSTDASIFNILKNNTDFNNKKEILISAQRNLVAEECSKDIVNNVMLPERIAKAHKEGTIFFHAKEFFLYPMINSCFVNLKDILENGTFINNVEITTPKDFREACVITSQVIGAISSNQYGNQTIDICVLGKFLRLTYENTFSNRLLFYKQKGFSEDKAIKLATEDAILKQREELSLGINVLNFNLNTLFSLTGTLPYVTYFLYIDEKNEYSNEIAMIIEEIFNQKIYNGHSLILPKLSYILDENNSFNGGKYDYLTELALECSIKTNLVDFISFKKLKENYVRSINKQIAIYEDIKNSNGELTLESNFNIGVVSLNLPQIGIIANGNEEKFWNLLDERLELCFEALMCKYNSLLGTLSDSSPIHWQNGGISRLKKGSTIDILLDSSYSSLTLGFIGLSELTYLMKSQNNSRRSGEMFALNVINYLESTLDKWHEKTRIKFYLEGTIDKEICSYFAKIDKEKFGDIENITSKSSYTSSYFIDSKEEMPIISKLEFEAKYPIYLSSNSISFIKIPEKNEFRKIINWCSNNIYKIEPKNVDK